MRHRYVEATNGANWGKFLLIELDAEEFAAPSALTGRPLLPDLGWRRPGDHPALAYVLDLQTGEGAIFDFLGSARADLDKHRVWVCPMFEPMLEELYRLRPASVDDVPALLHLPRAEFSFAGYRRPGPKETQDG